MDFNINETKKCAGNLDKRRSLGISQSSGASIFKLENKMGLSKNFGDMMAIDICLASFCFFSLLNQNKR